MSNSSADVARLQLKKSMSERLPPDRMGEKETNTCFSQIDSGHCSLETDAVPHSDRDFDMREQLGLPDIILGKSTEERLNDKKTVPEEKNTSQREAHLKNDTETTDSPNCKYPEQKTVLGEEQVAPVLDKKYTGSPDQGVRASKPEDAGTDIGQAAIDNTCNDMAKLCISHSEEFNSGDSQEGSASQSVSQSATCEAQSQIVTSPQTPPQETNTSMNEHCSQVSKNVPPISEDIGEVTTSAQPDSQQSTDQNKLNLAAAVLSSDLSQQHSYQTAREMVTSPHTPTQETITWEEEYFDVLLLHSEHDTDFAEKFMAYAERNSWKVTSPDEFPASVFKSRTFNSAFDRSSFTVLLLTQNFLKDCWCEMQYQTALVQSIENPDKRFCVIPVICQDNFKMPMELSVLTGVKMKAANCEKILKRTIKTEMRIKREREATSAHQESEVSASGLSLDELYYRRRPELNPGQSASRVIRSNESYRQICVELNKRDALGRDWKLVAEKMGFQSSSFEALKADPSRVSQILECFCQQQIAQGKTHKEILSKLHKMLIDMNRPDVANILAGMLVAENP